MPHPPRLITIDGRTRTIEEWAAEKRLAVETIRSRLDRLGWPPERALSAAPDARFRRGGRVKSGGVRPVPRLRDKGGVAFVRWRSDGRNHYRSFGGWGSAEATAAYRRFAAEWAAGFYGIGKSAKRTVGELATSWLELVGAVYVKGGRPTSEAGICKRAVAKLLELYGDTPAEAFGPPQLRTVRNKWIESGLTRNTVNAFTYRVVRCFRWADAEGMISPGAHRALLAVENLKPGRTSAPDRPPVKAVADEVVRATLEKLPGGKSCEARSAAIRAMVAVQRLTGMRPQHLCEMRPCDIDMTGAEWVYTPPPRANKTHHIGKAPRFYFGPRAQEAMAPFLEGCPPDRRVFGYQKGGRWYSISRGAYGLTIRQACRAAGVPAWHPHQLRHSLATEVAGRTQCIKTAAAAIGDTPETAARRYVHIDPQEVARREIARQFG